MEAKTMRQIKAHKGGRTETLSTLKITKEEKALLNRLTDELNASKPDVLFAALAAYDGLSKAERQEWLAIIRKP